VHSRINDECGWLEQLHIRAEVGQESHLLVVGVTLGQHPQLEAGADADRELIPLGGIDFRRVVAGADR
jgi:hypothetical protein